MKREKPPHPKRETRGDFDFPPDPLETTQRGGAAAPPLWIPLPGIGNACVFCPQQRLAKRKARTEKWGVNIDHLKFPPQFYLRERSCSNCNGQRSRYKLKSCAAPIRDTFVLKQRGAQRRICAKRPFLLTVNGRFLFGKTKRKWGFIPAAKRRLSAEEKWRREAMPMAKKRPPWFSTEAFSYLVAGCAAHHSLVTTGITMGLRRVVLNR